MLRRGSADGMEGLVADLHGLKILVFRSLIGLKCFALPVQRIRPRSAAVAATIASPARNPWDKAYSSM
jgi:hypothetical protein